MINSAELFTKMALHAWNTQISSTSELLFSLTDEQLLNEIAPGKNRGVYLLGHLLVYHDAMNDILGLGNRKHSDLDPAFMHNPDKSDLEMPVISTLKQYWSDVHQNLSLVFEKMQPDDWLKRHNAMTDEDFAKEPTRNKLSVLMNRTGHVAYHLGQIRLLK